MLLSAVPVLVVAQSSSEIPEGLMNNPVESDARCTSEIKSSIVKAKAAFNKDKIILTNKLNFNLRNELYKHYIWSVAVYDAKTCTLRKIDQK